MQIVENSGLGALKQVEPEVVQVTLNDASEILAVFPQLSHQFEENCREYDFCTDQYVESRNQIIIKKCKSPISSRMFL